MAGNTAKLPVEDDFCLFHQATEKPLRLARDGPIDFDQTGEFLYLIANSRAWSFLAPSIDLRVIAAFTFVIFCHHHHMA